MWWKNKDEFLPCRVRSPDRAGMVRFFFRQHHTIPALRLKHRSGSCGTASALPKCSIMSGCGTRIVLRGQKPLALCDRCPCFSSLFPPLAALTFAASSIICAFGLASAAPRSSYRHLELCGIAQTKCRNGTPCPAAADPNPSILRYYHRIRTRMAASMPLSCAVRPASTLPVTSSMV